jgi:hypothetical protein
MMTVNRAEFSPVLCRDRLEKSQITGLSEGSLSGESKTSEQVWLLLSPGLYCILWRQNKPQQQQLYVAALKLSFRLSWAKWLTTVDSALEAEAKGLQEPGVQDQATQHGKIPSQNNKQNRKHNHICPNSYSTMRIKLDNVSEVMKWHLIKESYYVQLKPEFWTQGPNCWNSTCQVWPLAPKCQIKRHSKDREWCITWLGTCHGKRQSKHSFPSSAICWVQTWQ